MRTCSPLGRKGKINCEQKFHINSTRHSEKVFVIFLPRLHLPISSISISWDYMGQVLNPTLPPQCSSYLTTPLCHIYGINQAKEIYLQLFKNNLRIITYQKEEPPSLPLGFQCLCSVRTLITSLRAFTASAVSGSLLSATDC